ncbi:hypothetical protein D3C87_2016800 [compost metagenome]
MKLAICSAVASLPKVSNAGETVVARDMTNSSILTTIITIDDENSRKTIFIFSLAVS